MKTLFASAMVALGLTAVTAATPAAAQSGFVGQIDLVGENFCPVGTAEANGQLLAISSNDALFSLYGTIYGGDGRTTFGLPDMRGRVPVSPGTGPGLSPYRQGAKAGAPTVTLTLNNLPNHTHTSALVGTSVAADVSSPGNALLGSGVFYATGFGAPTHALNAATATIGNTGQNQSINLYQPALALRYCVHLFGVYPSRN